MIKELIKVADRLDRFGLHKEASTIDALIKKVSSDESEYSREPEYLNKYEDSSNWSDEDWQRYMSESPYEKERNLKRDPNFNRVIEEGVRPSSYESTTSPEVVERIIQLAKDTIEDSREMARQYLASGDRERYKFYMDKIRIQYDNIAWLLKHNKVNS